MHIVEYMQQGFFHLLFVLNDFYVHQWSECTMAPISCDTYKSLNIELMEWIYIKLPYAAACVWQGEFCRQPFPHAMCFPFAVIV